MQERFPQPGLLGRVALFIQTVSPPRPITPPKKHMKITQRCDKSSCQILNVVFNRVDIDIDSDIDRYNDNTSGITAPEVKKKQEILKFPFWGSCLGFLRRTLPVPAQYFIVNLQRRNFHV